jgi:site-specific DNA-cytosine methylase
MKKEWEDIITKEMGVEPIRINSNLVSGQNRDRLYWTNIPNITQPEDKKIKLSDVLTDDNFREIPKCFYNKWGTKERINKNPNWVKNEKSNCLTTKNCHTNQYLFNEDKTLCRLLNPTEFEKLQTIPEGYTSVVSNTERYKMIGNGWTVDVIAHIFKNIKL